MHEENAELVRAGWDAWIAGDIDGLFEIWDPEVIWDLTHFRDWPDRTYQGHDGVRSFLSEWLAVWDEYEAGVDEIVTAPDGRIVTLAWQRGTGRESGLVMDVEWAQINTVRNGRVVLVENYDSRSEALQAAGLAE